MKTVFIGNYWQTNNQQKEPIEWIVLKETDTEMYLLSKYVLDCVINGGYDDLYKNGWKDSLIRKWLNEVFLNKAFNKSEQDRIILSDVKTSNTFSWNGKLDSGTGVQDKLFLPSRAEAILYFGNEDDTIIEQKRIANVTRFAYEKGCCIRPLEYNEVLKKWVRAKNLTAKTVLKNDTYETDTATTCWSATWVLRSTKNNGFVVCEDGSIGCAYSPEYNFLGIRPAVWVKK